MAPVLVPSSHALSIALLTLDQTVPVLSSPLLLAEDRSSKEKGRMYQWSVEIQTCFNDTNRKLEMLNDKISKEVQSKLYMAYSYEIMSKVYFNDTFKMAWDVFEEQKRIFHNLDDQQFEIHFIDECWYQFWKDLISNISSCKIYLQYVKSSCPVHVEHRSDKMPFVVFKDHVNGSELYTYYVLSWYYKNVVLDKNESLLQFVMERFRNDTSSLINLLAVMKLEIAHAYDISIICDNLMTETYLSLPRFYLMKHDVCITTSIDMQLILSLTIISQSCNLSRVLACQFNATIKKINEVLRRIAAKEKPNN